MYYILLVGYDILEMTSFKFFLNQLFKIKDLGLVRFFLGLQIISHDSRYLMHQPKYVFDLLEEFLCSNYSSVASLLDPSIKLTSDIGDPFCIPSKCIYNKSFCCVPP